MPRFTTLATVVISLVASVTAQSASVTNSASSPVITIFLLDENPEALVASLIGTSNSLTTLAVQCGPNVDASDCDYTTPITVTAGPSTVHASASIAGIQAEYGCDLTGTTTGSCSITYIGAATDLATDDAQASTATGSTTITTTGTLTADDFTFYPITLTAGKDISAIGASATSTASGSASHSASSAISSASSVATSKTTGAAATVSSAVSSVTKSASSAASAASSSASAAVATHSAGAGKIVIPGMVGAAVLGLAAFL